MKFTRTLVLLTAALTLNLLAAKYAQAQQSVWNVSSGDWNTAGNWSPSGVPTSSTEVIIGSILLRTANITSADAFSSGATIGNSIGQIGVVNVLNGRSWTNNGYNIVVGYFGLGTLNIQSGGKVMTDYAPLLGFKAGSSGQMTVTGAGSQMTTNYAPIIGYDGTGTLTVDAGGKVTGSTVGLAYQGIAKGTLNLNGTAGSRGVVETAQVWENTGSQGGTINFNGGILRSTSSFADFLSGFETGDVQILAGGAFIDSNGYNIGISVGLQGSSGGDFIKQGTGMLILTGTSVYNGFTRVEGGALQIASGGKVTGTVGNIAMNTGDVATLTVTGSGSQLTNSSDLYVGRSGRGTLNVLDGAKVSNVNGTIGRFSTAGGSGATVSGAGSEWTNSAGLWVGEESNGTLSISAGGKVKNTSGYLGYASGVTGTATVSGTGSWWESTSLLAVGLYGNGSLTVSNGGKVSNTLVGTIAYGAGVTGTATVTGVNSLWQNTGNAVVGEFGSGTLNVQSGGKVSNVLGYLGYNTSGVGVVNVTGAGSEWENSDGLRVGLSGRGTLNIEAGGKVTNTGGYLGYNPGSQGTATVTGTNSLWQNTSALRVGDGGTGALTIASGGTVTNTNGYIGNDATGIGEVTVTGPGSLWQNSNTLFVGNSGEGTLTVSSGGKVTSPSGFLGSLSSGSGHLVVTGSGSLWENMANISIGSNGSGTLYVSNGGMVSNTGGAIGSSSTATGEATVTGIGSLWQNTSILSVGENGNGSLTIDTGGRVTAAFVTLAYGSNSQGTLHLNGIGGPFRGVLETGYLSEGTGTGGGLVQFNGGILRATGNAANFIRGFETGDLLVGAFGGRIDTNGFNVTITPGTGGATNALSGGGTLWKQGAGTLTLNTVNTYFGSTQVLEGTLALGANGSIANSAGVFVQTGAVLDVSAQTGFTVGASQILGGGGTVTGSVILGGLHSPGFSPEVQTIDGDLNYLGGASVLWELFGQADFIFDGGHDGRGPVYDGINVTGELEFAGPTLLDLVFNGEGSSVDWLDPFWDLDRQWLLYEVGVATSGFDQELSLNAVDWEDMFGTLFSTARAGSSFEVVLDGNGRDVWLRFHAGAIPEPNRALLLLTGLLAAALRRRRREAALERRQEKLRPDLDKLNSELSDAFAARYKF